MEDTSAISKTLPDWYWRRGLHDAQLLAIYTDNANDGHRRVTILLDSRNALSDKEISGIQLHLAGTKSTLPEIRDWHTAYWLSDTLLEMDAKPTPLYKLEIRLSVSGGKTTETFLPFTITMAEILHSPAPLSRNTGSNGTALLWRTQL